MGVTASLVVAIQVDGKLWGLFVFHHYSGTRQLQHQTCTLVEFLARAFSIRLALMLQEKQVMSSLNLSSRPCLVRIRLALMPRRYMRCRCWLLPSRSNLCVTFALLTWSRVLSQVARKEFTDRLQSELCMQIAALEDIGSGLTTGFEDMRGLIQGSCGACCAMGELPIRSVGDVPSDAVIRKISEWAHKKLENGRTRKQAPQAGAELRSESRVVSCDRLKDIMPDADPVLCTGVIAAQIDGGWLMWFRHAVSREVCWAGDPNDIGNMFTPRASFDSFLVTHEGTCLPWTSLDKEEAWSAAVFIGDIAQASLSNEYVADMLIKLNEGRVKSRSQCAVISEELVGLIENANAPIFAVDTLGIITR